MDTSWIGPVLATYGLPGVALFALAWAYWQERKEHNATRDKLIDILVAGARTDTDVANSLKGLTEIIKERRP